MLINMYDDVELPTTATQNSACFDIRAYLDGGPFVSVMTRDNISRFVSIKREDSTHRPQTSTFLLPSGNRALIPTGLKMNNVCQHSLRLHPRSGLAWKHGITLLNAEGVIDSDYPDEIMVMLWNTSNVEFIIRHGDRIAQGEFVKNSIEYSSSSNKRTGGFGSTGV